VIVTPEVSNKIVFANGKPQTFKTCVPKGGQTAPIAVEGDKLKWKNAQKNATKSITSETINKIIPNRKPA